MLTTVTALLVALLTGLGAAGTAAQAATVDTNAWYVLVNRGSGKVLDVSGASTADGAAVQQRTRHDGANQRCYVRLLNRNSGKALEVENASTADGAKVVQFTDWGGANQ